MKRLTRIDTNMMKQCYVKGNAKKQCLGIGLRPESKQFRENSEKLSFVEWARERVWPDSKTFTHHHTMNGKFMFSLTNFGEILQQHAGSHPLTLQMSREWQASLRTINIEFMDVGVLYCRVMCVWLGIHVLIISCFVNSYQHLMR